MKAEATLRLDAYRILSDQIERDIEYGLRRCWKYRKEPCPDDDRIAQMTETIHLAVTNGIADLLETVT